MGIFESLFIGISIAAIPGPIFFEIVRRTLTRGFWSGMSVSIGDFIGNFLILLLIFFGISNFLTNSLSKFILCLLGSIILIFLGISAIRLRKEDLDRNLNRKGNSLLVGFLIAASSPIVIAFWISLSGSYLLQFSSSSLAFFNIFLITLGFIIFQLVLASVVHYTKHKIPLKYILLLSRIFGVILILYGLSFLYDIIKLAI